MHVLSEDSIPTSHAGVNRTYVCIFVRLVFPVVVVFYFLNRAVICFTGRPARRGVAFPLVTGHEFMFRANK
jgi:hypothetical protein